MACARIFSRAPQWCQCAASKVTMPVVSISINPCSRNSWAHDPRILRPAVPFASQRAWEIVSWRRGWAVLEGRLSDGTIPAVADEATVRWSLKKSVGDTLTYTNEKGEPIEVRIVATIGGSILQGNLIVSEENLTRNFPSIGGHQFFLIDAPKTETAAVASHLSEMFSDHGMEILPAWKRLAEFQTVENTYLSIFQVLGGFGLVLGSLGLGIVLVRNLLERKEEFALLRAIGYDRASLRFLIFSEYGSVILWGFVIGIAAAGVAVWPYLINAGPFPIRNVLDLLAALGLTSLFCAWMAAHFGLKSSEIGLLQNE